MRDEDKACDAIVRILEEGAGILRSGLARPEITRSGPPVDYSVNVGPERYAIEHSLIEAFEG